MVLVEVVKRSRESSRELQVVAPTRSTLNPGILTFKLQARTLQHLSLPLDTTTFVLDGIIKGHEMK